VKTECRRLKRVIFWVMGPEWPNNPSSFSLKQIEVDFLGALDRGGIGYLFVPRGLRLL
jgi:hypothetical protein